MKMFPDLYRGGNGGGSIFVGGEAKKFGGGDLKIFCVQNKPKKPQKNPPAAGGQGSILRREFVLLKSLVTFWEQNCFWGENNF